MSTEKNVTLVRRAVNDVWNGLDLDLADTLFGATYINHGGLIPDLVTGPESIKFTVVLQHTAFPHLHIWERAMVAEENLVELQWVAGRGPRSRGDSDRATRLVAQGTTLILCADDRITESWTAWHCNVSGEVGAADRRTWGSQTGHNRFAG